MNPPRPMTLDEIGEYYDRRGQQREALGRGFQNFNGYQGTLLPDDGRHQMQNPSGGPYQGTLLPDDGRHQMQNPSGGPYQGTLLPDDGRHQMQNPSGGLFGAFRRRNER